jgi:proteasome lid subunit RPN8/RPN11
LPCPRNDGARSRTCSRQPGTAVKASHVVVVCLSHASITKEGFVQKEIKHALDVALEKPEGTIFLIPLRLDACDVPLGLRRWQWVNCFEEHWHRKLLSALHKRAVSLGLMPAESATLPIISNTSPVYDMSGPLARYCCEGEPAESQCNIVFPQQVQRKILSHLSADTTRESGGLLLGHEITAPDVESSLLVIADALAALHTISQLTYVRFTPETFFDWDIGQELLSRKADRLTRVGWYHSHPMSGVFLSAADIQMSHMFQFRVTTPVALVVDPVKMDAAFFLIGKEAARPPQGGPKGFWQVADSQTPQTVEWNNMLRVTNTITDAQGKVIQERLAKA